MRLHTWLAIGLSVSLLGCGGAAADDAESAAGLQDPAPSAAQALSPALLLEPAQPAAGRHRVTLRWSGNESHGGSVSVWLAGSDTQPWRQIAANLRGTTAVVHLGTPWQMDWPTAQVRVRHCDASGRCRYSNAQPLVEVLGAGVGQVGPDVQTFFSTFSHGVALSGDGGTLVVANPTDFPATEPRPPGVGSIYVFQRDSEGRWRREAYIDNFQVEGNFGHPMALSGDGRTLVVGAYTDSGSTGGIDPPEGGSGTMWSGGVYVYAHDAAQARWTRQAFIKAAQPQAYEAFGSRLALSADGNRLVVNGHARVHVFERSGTQWQQAALLQHATPGIVLSPDAAIALSGDGRVLATTVQVGDGADGELRRPYTAVYVYAATGPGTWQQQADLRTAKPAQHDIDDDFFGRSLALDRAGTVLAVGAPRDPGDTGDTTGDPDNTAAPSAGAVYVFGADAAGTWQRRAFVKPRHAQALDAFGSTVALSADGTVLAAKACGFAAQAAGLMRNHSAGTTVGREEGEPGCYWGGSAYVFQAEPGGTWVHRTAIIPVGADRLVPFDSFSLAMSADAQTIALGATAYDAERNPVDRVYVY